MHGGGCRGSGQSDRLMIERTHDWGSGRQRARLGLCALISLLLHVAAAVLLFPGAGAREGRPLKMFVAPPPPGWANVGLASVAGMPAGASLDEFAGFGLPVAPRAGSLTTVSTARAARRKLQDASTLRGAHRRSEVSAAASPVPQPPPPAPVGHTIAASRVGRERLDDPVDAPPSPALVAAHLPDRTPAVPVAALTPVTPLAPATSLPPASVIPSTPPRTPVRHHARIERLDDLLEAPRVMTPSAPAGTPVDEALRAAASFTPAQGSSIRDHDRLDDPLEGLDAITILAPTNSHTLPLGDPPIVVVEGAVPGRSTSTVTLVANGDHRVVPVVDGRFRQVLPVIDSTTRFWAEVSENGAPVRSAVVTIGREVGKAPAVLVLLEGPEEIARTAKMSVTWRRRSDRLDEPIRPVAVNAVRDTSRVGAFIAFYVPAMKEGVYTFVLESSASPPGRARPSLYLHSAGGVRVRTMETSPGSGPVLQARVLLPQGTFWDDDDWFTGRSESVDTITKFRFPDGVSWIERKRLP